MANWWDSLTTPVQGGWQMGGGTGGGLLASNSGLYPYLGNIGAGLLAQQAPSLHPRGGLGAQFGNALQYASERQDQGLLNEARRMQITSSAQEAQAKAALLQGIKSGKFSLPGLTSETAGALLAAGDEGLAGKLIPQALTPEATAQLAAGYPAIVKAQQDVKKEEDLQGIERVTSNTTVRNALEAETIITRMEKGPVPPGSTAATLAKKLSDPDGYITVSPAVVAQASATVLGGKPMTEAQAAAWQTDWNRLNKLSAKFITDQRSLSAQQQATGGSGRQTDFGLSFIQDQNISPTVTGNANRSILNDLIQRQRDIAKVRGWTLDNEDTVDETLKKWEKQLTPVVDYSLPPPEAAPVTAEAPGVGVQNNRLVQQPAPVYRDLQPPAQAGSAPPAAPAARKVQTQRLAPGGQPIYRSQAELTRDFKSGNLVIPPGGIQVILGGELVTLKPAPAGQ